MPATTARPTWVRKLAWTLTLLAGLGLIGIGYAYFQITAEIDRRSFGPLNDLDAKEAERKLKIYAEAFGTSRRGFIRLSEAEINSYLQEHYFADSDKNSTNALASGARLLDGRVELLGRGLTWSCWLRKPLLGQPLDLVWQRVMELNQHSTQWVFQTKSMWLGNVEVPPRFWPFVTQQLGEADLVLSNRHQWFSRLPALEIKTNELSAKPELRLYTYRVAETLPRAKP